MLRTGDLRGRRTGRAGGAHSRYRLGSGLLSMMAARAGATNIVSCEKSRSLPETAQRIAAINGYEKQVPHRQQELRQLVVGEDIDAPADILISEILSSDSVGGKHPHTFEDATRGCFARTRPSLPRAATAVGCWWRAKFFRNPPLSAWCRL